MKASRYNFFINDYDDNIYLVYNAFNNTLLHDDGCRIQNFINQYNGDIQFNPDYITEDEFNDLLSSGVIISDATDEKQVAIDRNIKRLATFHEKNEVLSLVITPTLRCNFKCYYCFESLNTRKNEESISKEVQNDIIHFIEKSIIENHIKIVNITWYGGEPLLQQKILFHMQEKINEICQSHKIKQNSKIVTNGFLLSQETCKLLYKQGIKRAQITIDGPEHIHNKRRYYPADPANNYKQILENIMHANNDIRIQIRINIDTINKDYIFELIEDLIKQKIWPYKKNVSIYTAPVQSNSKTDLSFEEFYVLQDQIRYYLMEKYTEINNLTSCMKLNFFYPQFGGKVGCGYGIFKNSWVISYNGDLFRCWESVGQKEHKVGTVKDLLDDFGHSIFENIKLDNQTFEKWGCFDCKFFPICGSRCPWDFVKEKRCTEWKSILQYRLLNQYKQWIKRPEIFKNAPFNVL